jgi:hypothetical protein
MCASGNISDKLNVQGKRDVLDCVSLMIRGVPWAATILPVSQTTISIHGRRQLFEAYTAVYRSIRRSAGQQVPGSSLEHILDFNIEVPDRLQYFNVGLLHCFMQHSCLAIPASQVEQSFLKCNEGIVQDNSVER